MLRILPIIRFVILTHIKAKHWNLNTILGINIILSMIDFHILVTFFNQGILQ